MPFVEKPLKIRTNKGSKQKPRETNKTVLDNMRIKRRIKDVKPCYSDTAWTMEMRKVVSEFRKKAKNYSEDEIDNVVDEAVKVVRGEGPESNIDA